MSATPRNPLAADHLADELERHGRELLATAASLRGEAQRPAPSLAEHVSTLVTALNIRVTELEARLPPPRFTIPQGWIGAKEAIARSGISRSTLYRMIKKGHVLGIKAGPVTAIDPSTLPVRI